MPEQRLGIEIVIDKVKVDTGQIKRDIEGKLGEATKDLGSKLFSGLQGSLKDLGTIMNGVSLSIMKALSKLDGTGEIERATARIVKLRQVVDGIKDGKVSLKVDVGTGTVESVKAEFNKVIADLQKTMKTVKLPMEFGTDTFLAKSRIAQDVNRDRVGSSADATALFKKLQEADKKARYWEDKVDKAHKEGDITTFQKATKYAEEWNAKLAKLQEQHTALTGSIQQTQLPLTQFLAKLSEGVNIQNAGRSSLAAMRTELELLLGTLNKMPLAEGKLKVLSNLTMPGQIQTREELLRAQVQNFGTTPRDLLMGKGIVKDTGAIKVTTTEVNSAIDGVAKKVSSLQEMLGKGATFTLKTDTAQAEVRRLQVEVQQLQRVFSVFQDATKGGFNLSANFGYQNKDNKIGEVFRGLQKDALSMDPRYLALQEELRKAQNNAKKYDPNASTWNDTAQTRIALYDKWVAKIKEIKAEMQSLEGASNQRPVDANSLLQRLNTSSANLGLKETLGYLKAIATELDSVSVYGFNRKLKEIYVPPAKGQLDLQAQVQAFGGTTPRELLLGKPATPAAGLKAMNDSLAASNVTWKQFVAERMADYMRLEGGHKAAMKKLGEDWQALKASGPSASLTPPVPPAPPTPPVPPAPPTPPGGGKGGDKELDNANKQIEAIVKRMTEALNLEKGAADKLRGALTKALNMEGVDQGTSKLSRTKDMMIQVNGEVAKLSSVAKKAGEDVDKLPQSLLRIREALSQGADFKLFSKEKLNQQVEDLKAKIKELNDKAVLAGAPLQQIQQLSKDMRNINTPEKLSELTQRFTALNTAVGYDAKLVKLDQALDKLREKYAYLGDAADKVFGAKQLNMPYKSDDNGLAAAKGVALYGEAVAKARVELESLARTQQLAGADSHVTAWQKNQDAFLAAQLKNAEAQQRNRDLIAKAQAEDDAKAEAAAKRRLQRLQEIQGTRLMKDLDRQGLTIDNGRIIVSEKTLADAVVENERRKQAAIKKTADEVRRIAEEQGKAREKLDQAYAIYLQYNANQGKLGRPALQLDSKFTAADDAVKNITSTGTAAAARKLVDELQREIRAQSKNITVDIQVATSKESVARTLDKIQRDYAAMVKGNPSVQFRPLDTTIDYSKPLAEVKRRAQDIATEFQKIQSDFRLDKQIDAANEAMRRGAHSVEIYREKANELVRSLNSFIANKVASDDGTKRNALSTQRGNFITLLQTAQSQPGGATPEQLRDLALAYLRLTNAVKAYKDAATLKSANEAMERHIQSAKLYETRIQGMWTSLANFINNKVANENPAKRSAVDAQFSSTTGLAQAALAQPGGPTADQLRQLQREYEKLKIAVKDYRENVTLKTAAPSAFATERAEIDKILNALHQMQIAAGGAALSYKQIEDEIKRAGIAMDSLDRKNRAYLEQGVHQLRSPRSLVVDEDKARVAAYTEQINRLLSTLQRLSVNSNGAGVSLQQIKDELAKAGIKAKELDAVNFNQLNAGLKNFQHTLSRTTGELSEMKKAANAFAFLGETLGKMATRLIEFYMLRSAIFAVGQQFRETITTAIEFNQSIHDIIAIAGESRDGMGEIGQSIWDIAKASRFTAQEVAGLMQVLAQAGVKASELPGVSKNVGMFATATATDPKLAGELFTTAMNVYDIKTDHTVRITNALTAALNNSKLEASGLATAFNYLAPQAAQLGMSLEQTLGIISTMAQSGVQPSTIGTGVSQMLKEFAAPKQRLLNLLDYYGLTPDQINPIKHSFADIIDTLNNAKGKAGEVGVSVSHMFSALESRVGRSAVTAINLHGDAFRAMELNITNTSAALIAYDKSMEGAKARINVLSQTFREFISDCLEQIAPALIVATQATRGWLNAFNSDIGKAVVLGGTLVVTLGLLYAAVKALKAQLMASTTLEAGGFLASLASLPTAYIVLGITAIAGAVLYLGNVFDKAKQKEEEATKARLEQVEANQKMLDVLNQVKGSNQSTSSAEAENIFRDTKKRVASLKEYDDLMAQHGESLKKHLADGTKLSTQEQALLDLGNKKVQLTTAQKIAMEGLIAKNPELFADMKTEFDNYVSLINIIDKYNQAKYRKAQDAADTFNKEREEKLGPVRAKLPGLIKRQKELRDQMPEKPEGFDETKIPTPDEQLNKRLSKGTAHAATGGINNDDLKKMMKYQRWLVKYRENQKEIEDTLAPAKAWFGDKKTQDLLTEANLSTYTKTVVNPNNKKETIPMVRGYTSEIENLGLGFSLPKLKEESWFDLSGQATDPIKGDKSRTGNKDKFDAAKDQLELDKKTLANILRDAKENFHTTAEIQELQKKADELAAKIETDSLAIAFAENRSKYYQDNGKLRPEVAKAGIDVKARLEQAQRIAVEDGKQATQSATKTFDDIFKNRENKISDVTHAAMEAEQTAIINAAKAEGSQLEYVLKSREASWGDKMEAYYQDVTAIYQENAGKLAKKLSEIDAKFEQDLKDGKIKIDPQDADFKAAVAARNQSRVAAMKDLGTENQKDSLKSLEKLLSSAPRDTTQRTEKNADKVLRSAVQTNAIRARQAWSGQEVNQIAVETSEAEMANTRAKIQAYEEFKEDSEDDKRMKLATLEVEMDELGIQKDSLLYRSMEADILKTHQKDLEENNEKLEQARDLLREQIENWKELSDNSFIGNFAKGVRSVWQDFSNINKATQQFGSNVANTGLQGTADSISNAIGTVINPDTQKIDDLHLSINKLNAEKAQLETDIHTIEANTSKTPQEIATLSEKKTKLTDINHQLHQQNQELQKSTNAWAAFADGMKNTMKLILKHLQDYIARLLVVWAVQKLVGLASSMKGSDASATTKTPEGMTTLTSRGNLGLGVPNIESKMASGGFVPLSAGKAGVDSVPAMLMPGEVVINRDAVSYYGADRLLAYNDKKIKKFASGGLVGSTGAVTNADTQEKKNFTLTIINVADPNSVPKMTGEEVVNIVSFDAAKKGAVYKTIKGVVNG